MNINRKSTTEMSLSECSESYFSVNINLGEKKESDNLQVPLEIKSKETVLKSDFQFHNNIVKYVLQSFSSVTVHLEGEVYQVCNFIMILSDILYFRIFISEYYH